MLRNIASRLARTQTAPPPGPEQTQLNVLQQLISNRSRLLVKADGYLDIFQSLLLSVDTQNNFLVIDELFPQPSKRMPTETMLYLEHMDNGQIISFNSELVSDTRSNGLPAILIQYPDVIEQDQRRGNFRLSVAPAQTISAQLSEDTDINYYGVVKDISNYGLRINLNGNYSEQLEKGDVIPNCRIRLDKLHNIECQLTIRSKRYFNRPYRCTQIGTEITGIDIKHHQLLTQFVSHQQRQQCRARADRY